MQDTVKNVFWEGRKLERNSVIFVGTPLVGDK